MGPSWQLGGGGGRLPPLPPPPPPCGAGPAGVDQVKKNMTDGVKS